MDTISILRDLDIAYKKSGVSLSHIGSKIAEESLRSKTTSIIFIIGINIVPIIIISPLTPTAFFISTLLAIITFIPSDRYPPKSGT